MDAWVVGIGSTRFSRWPERTHAALADEAVRAALADAGDPTVEHVWSGCCGLHVWGQTNLRGQVVLDGWLDGQPVTNVEGGCATGSLALHGAAMQVAAGGADVALAVGVEKTWVPDDPKRTLALFAGGIDQLDPERWQRFFVEQAEAAGQAFAPHPWRVLFVDVHALLVRDHMRRHGTTVEQIAAVAAKNHAHAADNPVAQYRDAWSIDDVLGDKPVVEPFTRAMCAPIGDGAAAVVVASRAGLGRLAPEVRARAVRIRGFGVAGGTWRTLGQASVTARAAEKAWARSGVRPDDVAFAEVHDATSGCEILHLEALGLCPVGEGGPYSASGATARGGERPINVSGGLVSKGHPLAATGLGMAAEVVTQLRGEAGARQVGGTVGVVHNAGGAVGLDEAVAAVTVLERA